MHHAKEPTAVHSNTAVYIITQSAFDDVMTLATHYIITDESFNGIKGFSSFTLKVKGVISSPLKTPNRTAICLFEHACLAFPFNSMSVSQLAQAPLNVQYVVWNRSSLLMGTQFWLGTLVLYLMLQNSTMSQPGSNLHVAIIAEAFTVYGIIMILKQVTSCCMSAVP